MFTKERNMHFLVKLLFIALVATTLHQSSSESIFKKLAHDIVSFYLEEFIKILY